MSNNGRDEDVESYLGKPTPEDKLREKELREEWGAVNEPKSKLDKAVENMNDSWADPNKVGGKYMAGVIADFAPALKEIAKLGSMNNKPNGKYERGSWKLVENPEVEYHDAFWRHILEGRHEIDPESGMPHDVAIAWNAIVLVWFRLNREANEIPTMTFHKGAHPDETK